jgi:hypothetical protein
MEKVKKGKYGECTLIIHLGKNWTMKSVEIVLRRGMREIDGGDESN